MGEVRTDLTEMLDQIDMESYLDREGIDYRMSHGSRGPQLNVRECPVCGGDKWKVFLNAETGLGNCFSGSCEAKFNKFTFIRAHTGLAGKEVVHHVQAVAKEMGWRPRKRIEFAVDTEGSALKLPKSYELPVDGRNLKYLEERRIGKEMARYFHMRYSKDGLFFYKDFTGKTRCQDYANRVIIPVFDLEGKLVSFQGRDITGKAERKYLFPPGYASTGKYLFNGHNARGAKRIAVGEGVFDVAAMKAAFDEDTQLRDVVPVGSFGKHLSMGDGDDQMAALLRLKGLGLKEVTFMWDGELQAIKDACDAALKVHGIGLTARIARLPAGRDPNEVAPSVVRRAFWEAVPATVKNIVRLKMTSQ